MGIKAGQLNKGGSIKTPEKIDLLRSFLDNHPVFCFQFLQRGFTIDDCTKDEKSVFIKRICDLAGLKWSQIQTEPRDGIGAEKIAFKSIKPSKPSHITKETEFLSFRFGGKKCRFIGYKNDFIFHVIYIDPNLKVYNH